ncbi:maltokinase N-terminal cap-like domain-containing protein [Sinomonas susongensis]|uniref:maltokinase N-terminal cap-like domain-containing protein n=1 Tax=Sinomonas susongensis TaxID=1324851 RepID=UPI001108FD45|nr:hypothetical protein [Sinomonas susongensis]
MAVIHEATLVPGKLELLGQWLESQPWAHIEESSEPLSLARLGTYRFDDPEGEVGIEGFLLGGCGAVLHVLLTYRGAPLKGAESALLGTMEHSVLGRRWVYDGLGDPVAVAALAKAARGQQEQAVLELHAGADVVGRRESDVRLRFSVDGSRSVPGSQSADGAPGAATDAVEQLSVGGGLLRVARRLGRYVVGSPALVAEWSDEADVIAAFA